MNFKKFSRLVNHPRHIPGVHNYCDRWCARCPLTLRCSVFALEQHAIADTPPHEAAQEALWERLATVQPAASALLAEHANHPGVPVSAAPLFTPFDEPLDHHRLNVSATRYLEFAHQFVKDHQAVLATAAPDPEAIVSVAEAFEVIVFYHTLMPVKLARALSSRADEEEELADDPEMAEFPSDADGSAKVALIALGRTIVAWAVLARQRPDLGPPCALPAMVTLDRLRRGIEKEFPSAQAFKRPGFDTLKFTRKRIV